MTTSESVVASTARPISLVASFAACLTAFFATAFALGIGARLGAIALAVRAAAAALVFGFEVGLAASTVQSILRQSGLGRLDRGDRATASKPVNRYQWDEPGDLIHVDIKKLAAIPPEGGWQTRGKGYEGEKSRSRAVGYRYIHTAVDDRSRLAYSEILTDEKAATAAGFWTRATTPSTLPRGRRTSRATSGDSRGGTLA